MIVTVTLNAAIDRTLTVPNFQRGQRHRASAGVTLAGGKGINVARALKMLGVPVVATGLVGGATGTRIVAATNTGLPVHAGQVLGLVQIWANGHLLGSRALIATRTVRRPG
ncbi:MAG TPA: PfkB family carbohydrate kinase, partial [Gaiellaceae bacterium]|nr:PfkB family carbohydrate kinase [Gaiellaceae bacterium]